MPRLFVPRRIGIILATVVFAVTAQAQIDLYVAGDIVLSGINDTLYVQGNVVYNAGAGKMNMVANSALYFTGNFTNSNLTQLPFYEDPNPLLRSRGAAIADQGFAQTIGGAGKINFYSLEISKVLATQKVDLSNQVLLFNKLKMTHGDLNVGAASVIFTHKDTASYIVGETDANRIYGTTGYLQVKRFANSSLVSPARLGLAFNNLQDSVLVRRLFASQPGAGDGSIERYYEVRNSNGSVVGAYGESVYLDSTETNGHGQEANLRLFRSTDNGATWSLLTSTVDTTQDKVLAGSIQGITTDTVRYTIADYDCANPPVDSLGADTTFCNGDSILLNAGYGPGYTYLWSTGDTTRTVWVFATDTLSVSIMDSRGCTTQDTIVVTELGLPFVSLALGQDTVTGCPSTPIALDAGNPGSAYLWSTSDTTQLIHLLHADTTLSHDTVWVIVTDTNGCMNTDTVVYEKSPAPVVNLGGMQHICGGANALLNAAMPGPSGNLGATYLWNTGATLSSITVGTTGQYHVTVSNTYGCQTADTVQVSVAPSISTAATPTHITCNGMGNGSISLSVSGGTPSFTYLWSSGATTQHLSGLTPNTYHVTVTDAMGCTATASAAISQPTALTHTMSGTHVTCHGAADGTASVTVGGGTPAYTYAWTNGATTSTVTNLGPGTYGVTVTDANGCTVTGQRTVNEPATLTISLNLQQNISCNAGSNGILDIAVTGGTTAYSYGWSNGATTQDLSGVAAGSYGVTVTDAQGCQATASFTLTEPTALSLGETHLDPLCNGASTGSIDLTVAGGTPSYAYQWSNAATTQDLSGVGAGSYTVTVTDANACTATLSANLSAPPAMVVTTTAHDADCGQTNGAAAVHVTGGTPAYTYLWPSLGSTADSIANLPAGLYQVFVTDAHGCMDSATAAVNNAGAPTVTLAATSNVTCNGMGNGSISVNVSGGLPPYQYTWSNGDTTLAITGLAPGTYTLTVTAFDGCQAFFSQLITQPTALTGTGIVTNVSCFGGTTGAIDYIPSGGNTPYTYSWSSSATTQDLAGIAAGSYQVLLTDANGCSRTDSFTVTEPAQISLSHAVTPVACGGGSDGAIDLSVSGGTPSYTYHWSSGDVSQDVTGLVAGFYAVTVTDGNGCTATDTATVTQPAPIVLTLDSTDVSCNGGNDGSLDLTATGGTVPYTYLWSNSATTEDLTSLAPGSYAVTVTDLNGCTAIAGTTVNEPALLTLSLSATDVHCGGNANGTAIALVAGGTGTYHYAWSNTDTTSNPTGLAAGSYGLTVTDANGCTVTGTVAVIEPPTLSFSATIMDVTCRNQTDGAILVTPFGGSLPYAYLWNTNATTPNLMAVAAADYVLTLTDSAGCTFRDTLTVGQGDSSLEARFLMATVVNAEDTVYFLEFSVPLPTTVHWDFGDGSTHSTSYPWHVYADNPNEDTSYYQVRLAVANAWCADTLTKQITVVNGSGKVNQGPAQNGVGDILNVAVYPNPNMGTFHVDIALRKDMDASVQIIDLQGRWVTSRALSGDHHYHVEFSLGHAVAAGMYLVNIQAHESQKIVRIVKF